MNSKPQSNCVTTTNKKLSSIAAKPHDAFVQYAMGQLTLENTPLPRMCYHAEFGCST